ncbi:MAG: carboxypeptidase-like regulatory domain-containing protein [Salinivirgaceae bacterium]|nr:carboxypeptidase-like regulatory domain-containing protein [Salinivirgaceae bacterium]
MICLTIIGYSQSLTQVVKGRVLDAQTTYSLRGANVFIQGTKPMIRTTSDMDGYFRLEEVPLGRCDVAVCLF